MDKKLSRRGFIRSGAVASAAALVGGAILSNPINSPAQAVQPNSNAGNKLPRLNLETVNEFVIAGHFDLDKVKSLLAREPRLINAAWDWGGGDWETALGGASHTGHRAIAEYLIKNGARMDLFAAAMLDEINIVKAAVKALPENLNVLGPHGITLSAHAEKGNAVKVLKYLKSLT